MPSEVGGYTKHGREKRRDRRFADVVCLFCSYLPFVWIFSCCIGVAMAERSSSMSLRCGTTLDGRCFVTLAAHYGRINAPPTP